MTADEHHILRGSVWPLDRAGDALEALAIRSGLMPRAGRTPHSISEAGAQDAGGLSAGIEDGAARLGIEVEPTELRYRAVEKFLRDARPALLHVALDGLHGVLAVRGRRGSRLELAAPDRTTHRVGRAIVREALCQTIEAPHAAEVDRLLTEAGVPPERLGRARAAVLERRLAHESVGRAWGLRLAPGATFYHQLRCTGLTFRLGALVAAHTLQYVLWILSWWMIGRGALQGRLDPGWLLAWALMLITLVPFRLFVTWSQARIAIGTGGLLKRRLLLGALRLEPDRIRHQGVGQLLGRVIESEAVESLALSGGFLGLTAAIELVAAVAVLALGAGGWLHATLLVAWIAFTLLLGRRYFGQRRAWTEERVDLTHHLVETMVGHRTRLAQQSREQWHRGEDAGLERFMDRSRSMDRTAAWILAGAPRGWLVLGLLGLTFPFVTGRVSPEMLAVGLGGTLLAFGALERLAASVWHLTGAWIAWDSAAPVFRQAAEASEPLARTPPSARPDREAGDAPVIDAHNLVFRYRDHGRPVLRGCNLRARRGERILLEGASGGGKSTLASLLAGLRDPESGLVLLGGLDRATLGARRWVRGVAAAPQFHENHVLTETFAFNLLMGRRWPPTQADFEEAEEICHELGLGPLLERMPAGLLQMVGETGWQLSHGEKSRLYIARALLQNSDLVILDESFASLDPENLHRCVRSVLNRAPTLLVIAHP